MMMMAYHDEKIMILPDENDDDCIPSIARVAELHIQNLETRE